MHESREQAERIADQVKEAIEEAEARTSGGGSERDAPPWTHWVAFASLVMGLFSALGALLAGAAANEAILERTREILEMQAARGDRIEAELLSNRILLQQQIHGESDPALVDRVESLLAEAESIEDDRASMERFVEASVEDHEILEASVTLFALAISFCGMSVITRHRRLFAVGLGIGGVGLAFFVWGVFWFL